MDKKTTYRHFENNIFSFSASMLREKLVEDEWYYFFFNHIDIFYLTVLYMSSCVFQTTKLVNTNRIENPRGFSQVV